MKQELLKEARKRAKEIAEKTNDCPKGYYTAMYFSDNGIAVSYIQKGFDTRPISIGFGSSPLSEKQVLNEIELHQLYELQF